MATGYVTNWGNDANDGLSWETSKRTFQGAKDAGLSPVYAKGWFNEYPIANLHGVGNTIIDAYNIAYIVDRTYRRYNLTFKNFENFIYDQSVYFENCVFYNNKNIIRNLNSDGGGFNNCLIFNSYQIAISENDSTDKDNLNSTLHNLTYIKISNFVNKAVNIQKYIFSKANIWFERYEVDYSLFINSKFKFTGGTLGTDETDYTYPSGATDDDKLQNLRNRMATVYGGVASDYLIGCKYYSRNAPDGQEETEPYASAYKDIFVDADNGNFYLKPDSIAAHMAYDGSYVGARPVGATTLDISNWTNIQNINNTNGLLTTTEDDASADYLQVIDLQRVLIIKSFQNIGEIAARNGLQINTEPNLSAPISAGTNVLTDTKIYMVINDTITLDDSAATTYLPFDTFNAKDEGSGAGLGFSGNGQVQEVLIDKYDPKFKLKTSKEDPTLTNANTITLYLHQEPMVNLGWNNEPEFGNADAGFDPANAVPLSARYIGFINMLIKANNLPAR